MDVLRIGVRMDMSEKPKFVVGDKVIYHSTHGDQSVVIDETVFVKDAGWLYRFEEQKSVHGCKVWVHESLLSGVEESSKKS